MNILSIINSGTGLIVLLIMTAVAIEWILLLKLGRRSSKKRKKIKKNPEWGNVY